MHTCLVCKQDFEKPMQKFSQKFFANLIKNKTIRVPLEGISLFLRIEVIVTMEDYIKLVTVFI